MAHAKGANVRMLLDYESSYGTTPGTPHSHVMPFYSDNVKSTQTLNEDKLIRNNRNPAQPTRGLIDVSGSVVVPIDQVLIGYWLKAMFGAPTTTGSADPYTHVFKLGQDQPSLTIERGFVDVGKFFLYNGCKVGGISFDVGGEGDPQITIDLMGAKETISGTTFDEGTTITLTKFNQFQAAIKEGGSTIATVTKASVKIDFGLDGDYYPIGSNGVRGAIADGIASVTGSITAWFDDDTLLNKAINGTESSLEITFSAGATRSIAFLIPELVYERSSPQVDGPKGIMIDLPFRAYWQNDASNTAFQVTLKNAQASYTT